MLNFVVTKLFAFFGLPYVDTTTAIVILGLAFSAAVISGWLADVIMGELSFGIAMNGVVLVCGALLGLILLKYSGFLGRADFAVLAMVAASTTAVVLLLFFAFVRRFL